MAPVQYGGVRQVDFRIERRGSMQYVIQANGISHGDISKLYKTKSKRLQHLYYRESYSSIGFAKQWVTTRAKATRYKSYTKGWIQASFLIALEYSGTGARIVSTSIKVVRY